jgi:hypothetical protein
MDTIRLSLEMMYLFLPSRQNAFFLLRVMNGISTCLKKKGISTLCRTTTTTRGSNDTTFCTVLCN